MSLLDETVEQITPLNTGVMDAVGLKIQNRGWGKLADMLTRYAGITGATDIISPKSTTVIFCADHGVAALGVSAYNASTTREMTANYLISRGAAANAFANFIESDLIVVDAGIAVDTTDLPDLRREKIAFGTKNIAEGAAMTKEEAIRALEIGIKIADEQFAKGYRCFLPGEMGIANTTAAAAICAAVCNLSPEVVTGRGTNISDAQLRKKIEIVGRALKVNRPNGTDGLDVLSKVGGFEFGCIAGLILGAAKNQAPVILDGFNTGAAALLAAIIAPKAINYVFASHLANEPGHAAALKYLGLSPLMRLGLRLGEACGSSLAFCFLQSVIAMYRSDMSTDSGDALFKLSPMENDRPSVTDRTFGFYLNTMPKLHRVSGELCRWRLDHLAKPVDSLGYFEETATELAGICAEERPAKNPAFSWLCFAPKDLNTPPEYVISMAKFAGANFKLAPLASDLPLSAYFDFGREMAEECTYNSDLLGITALPTTEDSVGERPVALIDALLTSEGELSQRTDEFLAHAPMLYQGKMAAILGGIIAGAHNSNLVIVDDEVTEIVARYAIALCPEIRPYVLLLHEKIFDLGIIAPGISVALGKKFVDAAMYMLHDMKTFAESSVTPAKDGAGADRQI